MRHLHWLLAALLPLGANAAEAPAGKPDAKSAESAGVAERSSTHKASVTIRGQRIAYTATAGTLVLKDKAGKPRAEVFHVAYVRDGVRDAATRPVTYVFNGGPGSSSVWLHLGVIGPRRVAFADAVQPTPAPYTLTDNAWSLLDASDLVFIDPVGTGYSRALGDAKAEEFYGVKEDVESVGEFIRLWTVRAKRWNSPKFLAGESYGTTRAAGLVAHLQEREGMFFDGVMLISSILNFQTARFDTGNDLPYITFLPTYAATAWYHDRIPSKPPLETFLADARRFAEGEYAAALMLGSRLPAERRREVAARVAAFIGTSAEFVERTNLRPSIQRFTKELLRDQRRSVGRLDSRYRGIDADAAGERFDTDPSYTAILGPYTAVLNDYVGRELGYAEDRTYEILSGEPGRAWKWGGHGYLDVGESLRSAMSRNPHLRVHVANGYYDLATPFFATEYTFDHLGLEPELRANVSMSYYEAGHMMYSHPASLEKLSRELHAFVTKAR
ncbi:S10 family peptidase [Dokdonella sp. MW10]|uniref:S10 family peptidase n=1 Tax=Dokdonella sp. MW10 TaxID=2992926 RepID=UPI003F7E9233